MLSWIPILGPIIDGIVKIFVNFSNTELGKYKVDGAVTIEGIKASAQVIRDTEDDIGVRLTRDIIMFPVACWTALYSWDTIVALRWPYLMFKVADYPPQVSYLPMAVMTFLFGYATLLRVTR